MNYIGTQPNVYKKSRKHTCREILLPALLPSNPMCIVDFNKGVDMPSNNWHINCDGTYKMRE